MAGKTPYDNDPRPLPAGLPEECGPSPTQDGPWRRTGEPKETVDDMAWLDTSGPEYGYLGHFRKEEFLEEGHNSIFDPPGWFPGWSSPGGNPDEGIGRHYPAGGDPWNLNPAPRPGPSPVQRTIRRVMGGTRREAEGVTMQARTGGLDLDPATGAVSYTPRTGPQGQPLPPGPSFALDLSKRRQARAFTRLQKLDTRGERRAARQKKASDAWNAKYGPGAVG